MIAHLNINSLRSKFEQLASLMKGNIDILVMSETKIDDSFPTQQFIIEGYARRYRRDGNKEGGGVLNYVRVDLGSKELHGINRSLDFDFEGIFFEINLRKCKWLVLGGYNNNKTNIDKLLACAGPVLDQQMSKLDNFLILGDLNSEIKEPSMKDFCDTYNLKNLVKDPTCFKNPLNPSSIDVILTNKWRSFQNSQVVETGLSDHHKMTITVMKVTVTKQAPIHIKYRNMNFFNNSAFRSNFHNKLLREGEYINYEIYESIFMEVLNKQAPMKDKYVRANNAPFMNKILCKALMNRTRLRNKFLKNPNATQTRKTILSTEIIVLI